MNEISMPWPAALALGALGGASMTFALWYLAVALRLDMADEFFCSRKPLIVWAVMTAVVTWRLL